MKTPISYYGGKQRLVPKIIPLFPEHKQYIEPFTGGGAVYFAKPKSEHEVINDLDSRIVNFYRVLKTKEKFSQLQEKIRATLHSESEYNRAWDVLNLPMIDEIEFAWAFWVQTNMSFSFILCGSFAFCSDDRSGKLSNNKRNAFDERYLMRLETTEIFCRDAINLIKLKDSPDSFFYCDPPYVSSDKGHYADYTMDNFRNLLDTLATIKGKFLLSSYPEDILIEYRERYGWRTQDHEAEVAVTGKRVEKKYKTECLTWNYQEPLFQFNMFDNNVFDYSK